MGGGVVFGGVYFVSLCGVGNVVKSLVIMGFVGL